MCTHSLTHWENRNARFNGRNRQEVKRQADCTGGAASGQFVGEIEGTEGIEEIRSACVGRGWGVESVGSSCCSGE